MNNVRSPLPPGVTYTYHPESDRLTIHFGTPSAATREEGVPGDEFLSLRRDTQNDQVVGVTIRSVQGILLQTLVASVVERLSPLLVEAAALPAPDAATETPEASEATASLALELDVPQADSVHPAQPDAEPLFAAEPDVAQTDAEPLFAAEPDVAQPVARADSPEAEPAPADEPSRSSGSRRRRNRRRSQPAEAEVEPTAAVGEAEPPTPNTEAPEEATPQAAEALAAEMLLAQMAATEAGVAEGEPEPLALEPISQSDEAAAATTPEPEPVVPAKRSRRRKPSASQAETDPVAEAAPAEAPDEATTPGRRSRRKKATPAVDETPATAVAAADEPEAESLASTVAAPSRSRRRKATPPADEVSPESPAAEAAPEVAEAETKRPARRSRRKGAGEPAPIVELEQPHMEVVAEAEVPRSDPDEGTETAEPLPLHAATDPLAAEADEEVEDDESAEDGGSAEAGMADGEDKPARARRRRRRKKKGSGTASPPTTEDEAAPEPALVEAVAPEEDEEEEGEEEPATAAADEGPQRRKRRRRKKRGGREGGEEQPAARPAEVPTAVAGVVALPRDVPVAATPASDPTEAEFYSGRRSYKTAPIPGLDAPEGFAFMGLNPLLGQAIAAMGYEEPTPVQRRAVPFAMEGRDLIGLAQTGTGKTMAFLMPGFQRLLRQPIEGHYPRMLVLTPTRELAVQVAEDGEYFATHTPLRISTIYGGADMKGQTRELHAGTDVIVATPGRLLDHLKRGHVRLNRVEVLVLDEADRMLDMGFLPEIRDILRQLPSERQTMMFSATMPPAIQTLSLDFQREPEMVEVARQLPPAAIDQRLYLVERHLKPSLLLHLLQQNPNMSSLIVFTETKAEAEVVGRRLREGGVEVALMHGDRTQTERERALQSLRRGEVRLLVATNVAARGLDISGISHVVNYDVPQTVDDYVHRIGRTARGEAEGVALTLASTGEMGMISRIEAALERTLPRERAEGFDYDVPTPSWAQPSADDIAATLNKPKDIAERFGKMMGRRR